MLPAELLAKERVRLKTLYNTQPIAGVAPISRAKAKEMERAITLNQW